MSEIIKGNLQTFNDVVEAVYKSPKHLVMIATQRGLIEIRLKNKSVKKKWIEGVDYTIEGGNSEDPSISFKRVLDELIKEGAPEGKERDLSLKKNKYLYGTPKKEGVIK